MAVENLYLKRDSELNKYKIAISDYTLDKQEPYSIYKFGRAASVGTSEVTVWDGGSNYTFLELAQTLSVVSSSAADSIAAAGAQKIIIVGLDADYLPISEEVDMNGSLGAITTKQFFRTYRAYVSQSGTLNQNDGTITISSSTTADDQAIILPGNSQTLMALDTVPAGYQCFINQLIGSVGSGKTVTISAFRRTIDGTRRIATSFELVESSLQLNLSPPTVIDEKEDFFVNAVAGASGTNVSVSFNQVFAPIGYFDTIKGG
jgi:hypothetical protein